MGVAFAIAAGFTYVALAMGSHPWVFATSSPAGYYPLETAGFRSGHLYLPVRPLPELLRLADPYDPASNAPFRMHDMSLFQGRYYLYFGAAPVLVLFWPVAAVTGRFLSEPFAVALLCFGAVATGMGLLLALRRRYWPLAPAGFLIAGWACLAWATPLILLLNTPRVYQVSIACAAFLQALMCAAAYRAIQARRPLAWLAASGLLLGLSMAARPTYIAGAIVPLIAAAVTATRMPRGCRAAAAAKGLGVSMAPALLCGLGVLWFNWARFGSPTEFGIHYQLAAERVSNLATMSVANAPKHLAEYLFAGGSWGTYFPFFSGPSGKPVGVLRYCPWTWLLAAFALARGRGKWAALGLLAAASAANLALLACFYSTTDRYSSDFANLLLILSGAGALALGEASVRSGRIWLAGALSAALAAASLFFAGAIFLEGVSGPEPLLGLARAANWPAYALQRAAGSQFGGIGLDLAVPPGESRPRLILETGRQKDMWDRVDLSVGPDGRGRLGYTHAGLRPVLSETFLIPQDRRVRLEVRMGSLLPPFGHPAFMGWTPEAYLAASRAVRLVANGATVMRTRADCYPASPASTRIARLAWDEPATEQAFSGEVTAVRRLPLADVVRTIRLGPIPGPLEILFYPPLPGGRDADPIVATGTAGRADQLYLSTDATGRYVVGLDHLGFGGPRSVSFRLDALSVHVLKVWMGSFARGPAGGAGVTALPEDRLVVEIDGNPLLNIHQDFFEDPTGTAVVGANAFGASRSGPVFTGELLSADVAGPDALPGATWPRGAGRIELTVDLPTGVPGTQEPLVVTGRGGAGDFIYIRYLDAGHLAFGFDHWNARGILGDPVQVDFSLPHTISVSMASLYPRPEEAGHGVEVRLDGTTVLEGESPCYPSSPGQLTIAANRIGGSTCGPYFSGNVRQVRWLPEGPR
jgi:hypothetical protein